MYNLDVFNSIIFNNFLFIILIIYLLTYFINIFLIFLLITSFTFGSNNILKVIKNLVLRKNYYYFLLLVFGCLVGLPPLSIFISKFVLSFFIFYKFNIFISFSFYLFIIFNIFFYAQVFKLIKKVEYTANELQKNPQGLKNTLVLKNLLITIGVFFIFFFILFFKDIFFIFYFLLF